MDAQVMQQVQAMPNGPEFGMAQHSSGRFGSRLEMTAFSREYQAMIHNFLFILYDWFSILLLTVGFHSQLDSNWEKVRLLITQSFSLRGEVESFQR
jgi:hypothetical protein